MKSFKTLIGIYALTGACSAFAASGIFGTFVQIDDGAGGTWYAQSDPDSTPSPTFNGSILTPNGLGGSFTSGDTLAITDGEVLTFKNGADDVFGANIFYRVYETGSPSGGFTEVDLNHTADAPFNGSADGDAYAGSGDQQWGNIGSTPNLLSGIGATGNYTLELYWNAPFNFGTHFDNNGGANWTATFDFLAPAESSVPEPGTLAMLGVASAIICAVRRKRLMN